MFFRRFAMPISGLVALLSIGVLSSPAANAFTYPGQPSAPNCGATVYKDDGSAWTCSFDDEFNGSRLDTTKWVAATSFVTGASTMYACYVNTPQTVAENNGALHLSVVKVSKPVNCPAGFAPTYYAAGSVSTYHLFSQQYGRYEARIRAQASSTSGLNETFWLYPDDRYTTVSGTDTGEMDISQQFSNDPANTYPFLHYAVNGVSGAWVPGTNMAACAAPRGVWNTYDLTWTPTTITISVNGTTCLVNTSADPALEVRDVIAFTQALGADNLDAPSSSTTIPATMDIDYVRVWK